jgi:glycosyltransferase involved in cell wall biosynthesis
MNDLPMVSIIIPSLNEENFIYKCLDSIVANDYPADRLEVLVVDGMSSDRTPAIVEEYAQRFGFIRLLQNPRQVTPVAFNLGIQHSRGELIMIMSAHAAYAPDAIRKCVKYSKLYNAANVGGKLKIEARADTMFSKAAVVALSNRFGVGGAEYRTTADETPRWVDTAAFGCYRREVFERIGPYNEQLVHCQDFELNLRLRKSGCPTLLAPDVVITYFARTELRSFFKRAMRGGDGVVRAFACSTCMPVRWRHLVPLMFVSSILVSALLAAFLPAFAWLLAGILVLYAGANLAASLRAAYKAREPRLLLCLPAAFAVLHIAYGIGSLKACAKLAAMGKLGNFFLLGWRQATSDSSQSGSIPARPVRE